MTTAPPARVAPAAVHFDRLLRRRHAGRYLSLVPVAEAADWLEAHDERRGRLRMAAVFDGAVEGCLFLARDAVRHAVSMHPSGSVRQIGALPQAGTNCGSCIPELEEILRDVRIPAE